MQRNLCRWTLTAAFGLVLAVAGCDGSNGGGGQVAGGGDGGGASDGGGGDGGGGGSIAGGFGGDPQSLAPYKNALTSDEAYHLLRRAAFGGTPENVQAVIDQGLAGAVENLLTIKPMPDYLRALANEYEADIPRKWLVFLVEGPNPLQERMAMFWHDRFATARRVLDGRDRNLAIYHWDMLRRDALGNYRQFLEDLTLDPLMLIWLDGANSPKDNPNENYAREFWELFTLGRDTLYTEGDIKEAARAFTGITLLRESGEDARPIFDIVNHDETLKDVFPDRAQPANHNYESIINLTLEQPEAPRYVARNLFVYFVHDHPSDAVVQELADLFVASNFEIKPLVRKILNSSALFSSEARFNQITSPVEHFVGVARTLDLHFFSEDSQGYLFSRLRDDLSGAGQELLNPPGVQGWAEGEPWLQDQWVLNRVRALGEWMDYGPDREEDLPYHLLPPRDQWDQREIRGRIVDRIAAAFHLHLTDAERDIYIEVLDQNGHTAFHLIDSRYQPRHVQEMIRLMAMHEDMLTR